MGTEIQISGDKQTNYVAYYMNYIWITIINPDVSYWIKANYRHLIYTSLWCLTYAIHFRIAACFTTPQQGTCWTWIKCCDSAHLGDQMIRDCWPEKRAYCTRNTVCPPGNARFISIPCDAWTCQRAKYSAKRSTKRSDHELDSIKHDLSGWNHHVFLLKTYTSILGSQIDITTQTLRHRQNG